MSDLKYGIAYKTELSIKEIEDWMEHNCSGNWDVRLADLDDSEPARMKKKVELFFEIAEDKENFKSNFSKRK
ncbi:MAG: hypothetical protein A3G18_02690 [Rhodospirillales bacterium RIFCSPLOWO2_12_FULL_58_28]|nr:MAG: hypothetical protein A3H92_09960 [Rhodospirillales bacterium RIFCSPLOWO2_02_FULL_58_16]OHC79466.1 MAG: hypothetical protein A3G18_02690 [Rhodospirillales bacterium RIFCSPLOWO2_12_FULL_58_28]